MKLSRDQINALVSKINQTTRVDYSAMREKLRTDKKNITEAQRVARIFNKFPLWLQNISCTYHQTETSILTMLVDRQVYNYQQKHPVIKQQQVTYNDIVILTIGAETVKDILEAISKQLGRKIEL